MLMANKQKGLFVVADPDEENGKFLEALVFGFEGRIVSRLVEGARHFYRMAILPALVEKYSD